MKGGFLCPRRAVRQGGGHHHLVPTLLAHLSSCIYTFLFVSSTPRTRHPSSPLPLRPYTARVVCPVPVPPLLSRFCMRGEQPRRTVANVRKRGRGRGRESSEKRVVTGEEGRRVREKSSKGTKDARMH